MIVVGAIAGMAWAGIAAFRTSAKEEEETTR